ncbi:MAG: hypothetical protein IJT83_08045 [Victivallales bacterium]|nr:hypothetical protein [Victivallales bacterium]
MQKFIQRLVFLQLVLTVALFADIERISMTIGTTKTVEVPFVIESYRIFPKKAETIKVETTDTTIRIIANKLGDVNVIVEGGGQTQEYAISVKSNLSTELRKLRNDLDTLTELDISINEDRIVIKGTVTNPEHWGLFNKVMEGYRGRVTNLAVFKPSPETVLNLKKLLTDAGFAFCEEGALPGNGELSMKISGDTLMVAGQLYSQEDVSRVNQILSMQSWLDVAGGKSTGKIKTSLNLKVVETLMEVDIVYVAINSNEASNVGSNSNITGTLGLGYLWDAIMGKRQENSLVFGGNMNATVRFLANNGISRIYNAGHVSFLSNDPTGASFHTGGTVKVKVSGSDNGSLQDITYGLQISVKGGIVAQNQARLTVDIKNSAVIASSSDAYNLSEDSTKQTVVCELDNTVVLAGSKKISEDTSRSGLPVLRNTPVLKWFVSTDGKSADDSRLLILMCPRIVRGNADAKIKIPLSEETGEVYPDAQKDVKTLEEEKDPTPKVWYKRWFKW